MTYAPVETLAERIQARSRHHDNVSDADLELLSRQLAMREAVDHDEAELVLRVTPAKQLQPDSLPAWLDG